MLKCFSSQEQSTGLEYKISRLAIEMMIVDTYYYILVLHSMFVIVRLPWSALNIRIEKINR